MKSHQKSTYICLVLFACSACSSAERTNKYQSNDEKYEEVSLKKDREDLAALRTEVPPDIRKDNDDKAFILSLFQTSSGNPDRIREKFDREISRKRDLLRKLLQKDREEFTAKERKSRDLFLKDLQKQREAFRKNKHSRDEQKDFYDNLDTKRKDYFANEREKRADFESVIKEKRTDLEAYFYDLKKSFNDELTTYKAHYQAEKREKEERETQKRRLVNAPPSALIKDIDQYSPEVRQLIQELDEMYKKPAKNLND